jgi:geranylgeranyl reductase family protein
MNYDVIVVGAGPGGSTCARYLAKRGLDVILIDKDEFPRDKPCGGGFSYNIIRDFSYLKKRESEFLDGILRTGVIHSPNRRITLKGKVDMAVTRRTNFDFVLFNEAIDAGATTLCGSRVNKLTVTEKAVNLETADGDTFQANLLVGADGVTSFIARETGLHEKWRSHEVTVCRVVELPLDAKRIDNMYGGEKEYHFFVNFNHEPGYGWIFPKLTTVNVGLGVVGKHAAGLPRKFVKFINFLKKQGQIPKQADLSRTKGALVPTAGTIDKTYSNRVILVGDSAGMVSPITGGGIAYAMRAGRIAAHVIQKNFQTGEFNERDLALYQRLWENDFGHEIRPQLLAQKIFTSPLTDALFEIGRRDRVIQEIVTNAMSESNSEGPDIKRLLVRVLLVCLRGGLHL